MPQFTAQTRVQFTNTTADGEDTLFAQTVVFIQMGSVRII